MTTQEKYIIFVDKKLHRESMKKYYEKNKIHLIEYAKNHYKNNITDEKRAIRAAKMREHRRQNPTSEEEKAKRRELYRLNKLKNI